MSTSATASNAGIQLGFAFSNAQQDIGYYYNSFPIAQGTTQTSGYLTVATANTVTQITTVATNYIIQIEGTFKSNATTGGTLIPQLAQSVAGSAVAPSINANTWFMIQPIGGVTDTIIAGSWS